MDIVVKCDKNIIINDCGNHSCEQCQTGDRFDCWNGSRDSWWVIKYKKINIVIVLKLLIIRCIIEKKDMFYIHSLIVNLDIEFVYKIYFNYKFSKFKNH